MLLLIIIIYHIYTMWRTINNVDPYDTPLKGSNQKHDSVLHCIECWEQISKAENQNNDGLCNVCFGEIF